MEEKKAKIKKVSRFLYYVTSIIEVITCIAGILAVLTGVLFYIKQGGIVDFFHNIGIRLDESLAKVSLCDRKYIIMFFVLVLLQIVITIYILNEARLTFKNIMIDGIPYRMCNAKRIKHIAAASFISCLIPNMYGYSAKIQTQLTFSNKSILLSLVFYGIAKVFEYGCDLQKESDELL